MTVKKINEVVRKGFENDKAETEKAEPIKIGLLKGWSISDDIYAYSILGLFILSMVIMIMWSNNRDKSLKENAVPANAVIYDFFKPNIGTGAGGKKHYPRIYYHYRVDDIEYKRSGRWYPLHDTYSIGDTVEIFYDRTNPSYSKTTRDFLKKFEKRAPIPSAPPPRSKYGLRERPVNWSDDFDSVSVRYTE